jgi:hypothetical protein
MWNTSGQVETTWKNQMEILELISAVSEVIHWWS